MIIDPRNPLPRLIEGWQDGTLTLAEIRQALNEYNHEQATIGMARICAILEATDDDPEA